MFCAHWVRGAVLALGLCLGGAATGLVLAPTATGKHVARASRSCAHANSRVTRASVPELRAAVVCLINRARKRWHLPALHEQGQLELAAQSHTNDMVARGYFAHSGAGGPGGRVSHAGYRWGELGENLSTGYGTPRALVHGWIRDSEHCWVLLAPYFRDVGVGMSPQPVRSAANVRGTWTADLALRAGARQPSHNSAPASSCPH